MENEHAPGAPVYVNCGFCTRTTQTAVTTNARETLGILPICEHCTAVMNGLVYAFGYDTRDWDVVKLIHGDTCPEGLTSHPTPDDSAQMTETNALDEVYRILGKDTGDNDDGTKDSSDTEQE